MSDKPSIESIKQALESLVKCAVNEGINIAVQTNHETGAYRIEVADKKKVVLSLSDEIKPAPQPATNMQVAPQAEPSGD